MKIKFGKFCTSVVKFNCMSQKMVKTRKHFRLSRKMVKYFCFIFCAVVMALFLLSVANKALNIVKDSSLKDRDETATALVHEYALISKYVFELSKADLRTFSHSFALRTAKTEDEVQNWLKRNSSKKAFYFDKIVFAFSNGICITEEVKFDASDKLFFSEIMKGNRTSSVVGPFIAKDNEYIIVIAQPVYDFEGNVKGVMSGTIKLSTLRRVTDELKINTSSRFFMIGDDGNFVCHSDESHLGKSYSPEDIKYSQFTSLYFGLVRKGAYDTKDIYGKPVRVYLEPIDGTRWTCGVVVPEQVTMDTYKELRTIILSELFMAILIFLVLFVASSFLLNNANLWESYYDDLTELWTRAKFEKEAQHLLDRNKGARFAVMEIDIPGFKFINQGYGQKVANELLKTAASEIFAFSQYNHALCGRGYADHFYFISKIDNVGQFMEELEQLQSRLLGMLRINDSPIHLKYGLTFLLPDNQFYSTQRSIQTLIGETSYAKAQIKKDLLQSYSIYSLQMKKKIEREQLIERQMEKALANNEFFVVYQPKIDLRTDRIIGAEALVRWQSKDPELGYLSPGEFIPVFERNGFIVKLDFAVYEMVFKFIRRQLDEGNPVVPISVNMSRNHSNPEKFVADFVNRFRKYDIPSDLVEIEIIERSIDEDAQTLITVTERLHQNGFSVAMDDFGSGQSSLNMLSAVPIDVLKFDQNFLKNEKSKKGYTKMINTLIELGRQLDKKTLFEGVETEEQRDMLREMNCDSVQGYFYSKPLPEADFVKFVKEHI